MKFNAPFLLHAHSWIATNPGAELNVAEIISTYISALSDDCTEFPPAQMTGEDLQDLFTNMGIKVVTNEQCREVTMHPPPLPQNKV